MEREIHNYNYNRKDTAGRNGVTKIKEYDLQWAGLVVQSSIVNDLQKISMFYMSSFSYWSICYEFICMFYLLFAKAIYLSNLRYKLINSKL